MRPFTTRTRLAIGGALIFVWASALSNAVLAQNGIRGVNFNEFSYRVGPPYCDEFGPEVKVHQGKFANDKATFEVSQVLYGSFTGSGQERAVVVTTCSPKVVAHPGFEDDLVYVFGKKGGQVNLIAAFAFGEPWNFSGRASEPTRRDDLLLFDITGVSVAYGGISFERMAGRARCCPTFSVTQTFRWSNRSFALAREQKRPWQQK